ncbi:MAG TPA: hypothetical protein DCX19_06475 [Alphaproteobacteria bacterium]|nr:hypothetical protein [Alphaproteobacteria bacterium]
MGKKKESKKFKPERESCFDGMEIDSRETLLAVIDELRDFCNENILALKPLLDEVEDNEIIKRRIINFVTISDILDSVEQLADANVETGEDDEEECECGECECGGETDEDEDDGDEEEESEIPVKIVKKPCKNCKSKKKGK